MGARGCGQKGFTLIELVISMTILALVITVIAEAFWLGQRSWDRGRDVVDTALRLRSAVEMVSKQLRSTFPLRSKESKDGLVFSGNSNSIRFITTLPLGIERRGGLFLVEYKSTDTTDGLMEILVHQRTIHTQEPFDTESIDGWLTVIKGLGGASWAYYREGAWSDSWDGDGGQLPDKIKLTITYPDDDDFETVIPVLAVLDDT
jgi:prepilin-type N-terminal cleavage/methylation domain-containing protein